jgi:hypothetical protein
MRTIAAILMTCLLVGCARTETYQVTLTNRTDGPITFGLVKQGEPFEVKWAPPDIAATYGAQPDPEMWGSIGAGKTAVSKPEKGRFASSAGAYLRIYEGKLDLAGVMAVSRGSSTRADILLTPGQNHITASIEGGKFVATRDGEAGSQ